MNKRYMNKRKIGDYYEELAVKYLVKAGYEILEKNYRNRYGEIDIIAREKEYICFCEVKFRTDVSYGAAAEAVDYYKQRKIVNVAKYYMMMRGYDEWTPCRFDVIAMEGKDITLLRNAFNGSV